MATRGPSGNVKSAQEERMAAVTALLSACAARFTEPDFHVECDPGGVVWVRNAQGRSIGLQSWLLNTYSTEQLLERVERKLGS